MTRDAPGVSSDANLGTLSLSAGTLNPAFDAATTSYTATVENAVTSVTVTATASHADASTAQEPDNPVALDVGATPITVTVTAGDGTTTKAYTVTVTRSSPGASSDADLSDLSLSAGTLSPAFNAATTSYTASVANTVSSVTVTATASHASATMAQDPVNPVTLDSGRQPDHGDGHRRGRNHDQGVYRHGDAGGGTDHAGVLVSIEEVTVHEGTERDYTVRLTTRPSGPQ